MSLVIAACDNYYHYNKTYCTFFFSFREFSHISSAYLQQSSLFSLTRPTFKRNFLPEPNLWKFY